VATARAYRRISGPLGSLLGAAHRVSAGQYDVSVEPEGPRELRSLIASFNDMAARLRAADEQRRRFLADVTHELRTPVAVLQSRIEAQLDGIHPRDDSHLSLLLEETKLLGRLIDDLHTLALADAGRLVLHYERTHPGVLVEEAVSRHGPAAERAGVTITTAVADDLPDIDVDPTRILQVLGNLLANAVRHTPAGGTVIVEARPGELSTSIAFAVSDEGPGFPPEQLPHLFDRFTGASQPRGSGLGLSIARDLVAAHGGTIEAGQNPSGGARVRFAVPVTRPAG
jgi:signal transduction histidine kinase